MSSSNCSKNDRANSSAFTLWLTGLPASGKSTLAKEIITSFQKRAIPCELLDGDIIRENLSKDLGFSKKDRDANVYRVSFICGLLNKHGINAVVALVSPYQSSREQVRLSLQNFIEVYVDCPLDICIERDPKGLYGKALAGEILEFTGISSPYEPPTSPDLHLKTHEQTPDVCLNLILEYLDSKNIIAR